MRMDRRGYVLRSQRGVAAQRVRTAGWQRALDVRTSGGRHLALVEGGGGARGRRKTELEDLAVWCRRSRTPQDGRQFWSCGCPSANGCESTARVRTSQSSDRRRNEPTIARCRKRVLHESGAVLPPTGWRTSQEVGRVAWAAFQFKTTLWNTPGQLFSKVRVLHFAVL